MCLVALSLAPEVAHAELVTNGDFSGGMAGWFASGATVTVSGGKASITARTGTDKSIRQSLSIGPLLKGKPFRARCDVGVATATMVRLTLIYTDGTSTIQQVLAERVIRQSQSPETLQGSFKLDWTTTIASPILFLNLGHKTRDVQALPGGGLSPDYTLDNISVDDDTDGDGISDSEEVALGTNASNRDTDGDGIPDLWERDYGTFPLIGSAGADPDSDTFTNYEEYYAATDPQSSASLPGEPCDPLASPAVRAVLRFLALRPSSGVTNRTLCGQHAENLASYNQYVVPLGAAPYQHWPAILSVSYDSSANPPNPAQFATVLKAYWQQGGLVAVNWHVRHPWTQGLYGYCPVPQMPCPVADPVNIPDLLNPVTTSGLAARQFLDSELDVVGAGLADLQSSGVVVMFRTMVEMNGGHFWWGARGRQEYVDLYRYIRSHLIGHWNLHNIIWCCSGLQTPHPQLAADYYYPGDDAVDIFGMNIYDGSFNLTFDVDAVFRRYPKVHGLCEVGPDSVGQVSGAFSNLIYLQGADGLSGLKFQDTRAVFFIPWNSFNSTSYHYIAIIDNPDAAALLSDPWVMTRDEIPFAQWLSPMAVVDGWRSY
ncbi:MAG: carbohydrate binding domain-containing protein [Candidatus Sumerlaeaceae bacterium]|nr:carbohydrate binding domain-containing protein [Candidatus Sumerlaeaceae bacterium]